MEDLYKLKHGDKVLVECTVEAVFVNGGLVAVTTRDCDDGFDAYVDEVKGISNECNQEEETIINILKEFEKCKDDVKRNASPQLYYLLLELKDLYKTKGVNFSNTIKENRTNGEN